MRNISIFYNEPGLREIMKGPEISKLEEEIMMQKYSQIQAEFLNHFGFVGKFEVKRKETRSRRSRVSFRVVAADARTTSALKKEPGWLAKFI